MWTYWGVNWFFLPNPIFAICLNFQQQNSLKNQYLQQLSSDFFEINSIKPGFWRAFQEHQECFQIPIKFSILILFSFHWENGSIINSFHTIVPNSFKLSGAPLVIESFPKIPRAWHFWEIWKWQNKTRCAIHNGPIIYVISKIDIVW